VNNDDDSKPTMTPAELLAEIRKTDPGYTPKVIPIKNIDPHYLKPIPFDEFMGMDFPPLEYVLYPCLPVQGLCFIYAASGIGKTLFTLNMAYAIAGGGNFLKYSVPKPRKVLYIDAEMQANQLHERLQEIEKNHGQLYDPKNLNILTPDKILPFRLPKINDKDGQETYDLLFDFHKYEVIVLDNLSMLATIDENKSHEWLIIQDWLLSLRAKGKTVIIIHHAGKDKNGYRGTSRMLDCVDTAISLQPIIEDDLEENKGQAKKFKVVYEKSRLFGGADILPFEVTLENKIWRHRSAEEALLEQILKCLDSGMSQREIAKELFLNQTKVFRLIKTLRINGRISK